MKTIIKSFEAQVAKTPDRVAVVFGHHELTYSQLNRRANQLANHLQKMGVAQEKLVGLFFERSLEMIISILGVLKAGGAYVPMDPDYPPERVAFILEDTQVSVLLSQSHLKRKLSEIYRYDTVTSGPKVIFLDSAWDEISQLRNENPSNGATPDNLAYVIYTSGSTGKPKGVMIEHRSIYNRLIWMRDAIILTEKDRVLQKTPYSFDVSIWEFFWPLLSGACLVVAKPGGHKDSEYLVNLIIEQRITVIHFVPSMLQVFLLNQSIDKCHSLKRVICGGEVLPYELTKHLFSRLDVELYNLYGPTETAIGVTYWACERDSELSIVPIGKPLPNVKIYILDSQLKEVPLGEDGELHIGGIQVGRGYHNRPKLTIEKFIHDPFSTDPAARLYKTGDLARYLPDGAIHFLGRIDHQVKIRGNRVELGEIETTLLQYPGIREAVITTHKVGSGEIRLAAYVVAEQRIPNLRSQLRQFLVDKLPEYMIPASFTFLDRVPLTLSGKVDRKALTEHKIERRNLNETYVAPRNFIEETLAGIWEQVIGLDRVGVNDNFLELGGDSIQSIYIASRANQAGIKLSPNQLLQYPTIAELAAVLATDPMRAEQGLVTGILPLTPVQKWLFKQDYLEPDSCSQVFLIDVSEILDTPSQEKAIRKLLVHHDALRLRIKKDESGWHSFIASPDDVVNFSSLDLSGLTVEEQEIELRSIVEELQTNLNLSKGPLLRVAQVNFGYSAKNYLLLVIHHLAVDSVSWKILLQHLSRLYQQLHQNQPLQLPPKTTSYKQWAHRITEYEKSGDLYQELSYWLALQNIAVSRLPTDEIDMEEDIESSMNTVSLTLNLESTRSLLKEVSETNRTQIIDVLLAALAETLSIWTRKTAFIIDIDDDNRDFIFQDIDLSSTVGCFSKIYPVVLDLGNKTDSGEILLGVKEQLRQVPNGGLGYSMLRYLSQDQAVTDELEKLQKSEISFKYIGQLENILGKESIFNFTSDFCYPKRSINGKLKYSMEITSFIFQEKLYLKWNYRTNVYRRSTIKKLAADFMGSLEKFIEYCKLQTRDRYTPSDFPEANLSQEELDNLLAEIDEYEV